MNSHNPIWNVVVTSDLNVKVLQISQRQADQRVSMITEECLCIQVLVIGNVTKLQQLPEFSFGKLQIITKHRKSDDKVHCITHIILERLATDISHSTCETWYQMSRNLCKHQYVCAFLFRKRCCQLYRNAKYNTGHSILPQCTNRSVPPLDYK